MVLYDFGTIIDEVPKNLHFVRILGAEDVFDSYLLHFFIGGKLGMYLSFRHFSILADVMIIVIYDYLSDGRVV